MYLQEWKKRNTSTLSSKTQNLIAHAIQNIIRVKNLYNELKPHPLQHKKCSFTMCNPSNDPVYPALYLCNFRKVHLCTFQTCSLYHKDGNGFVCPISGIVYGDLHDTSLYGNKDTRFVKNEALVEDGCSKEMGQARDQDFYIDHEGVITNLYDVAPHPPSPTRDLKEGNGKKINHRDEEKGETRNRKTRKRKRALKKGKRKGISDNNWQIEYKKQAAFKSRAREIIFSLFFSDERRVVNHHKIEKYRLSAVKSVSNYINQCKKSSITWNLYDVKAITQTCFHKERLEYKLKLFKQRDHNALYCKLQRVVLQVWKKISFFNGTIVNGDCVILATLYLLRSGFTYNNINVLKQDTWVAHNIPSVVDLNHFNKQLKINNATLKKGTSLVKNTLRKMCQDPKVNPQDIIISESFSSSSSSSLLYEGGAQVHPNSRIRVLKNTKVSHVKISKKKGGVSSNNNNIGRPTTTTDEKIHRLLVKEEISRKRRRLADGKQQFVAL